MNNEQLTAYLKDESYLYTLSYEELKTLVVQYPYATNLRVLLLKKSYIEQNKDYERNLQMAAAYSTNRRFLYKLVKKLKTLQNVPENVILGEDYLELTELSNIEKMLEGRHVSEIYNDNNVTLSSDLQLDWGGVEFGDNINTSTDNTEDDSSDFIDLTMPLRTDDSTEYTDESHPDYDEKEVDLAIEHILSEFGASALDFTSINGNSEVSDKHLTTLEEFQSTDEEDEKAIIKEPLALIPTLEALYESEQNEEEQSSKNDFEDVFSIEDLIEKDDIPKEIPHPTEPLDFENLEDIKEIPDSQEPENQIIDEEIRHFEELEDNGEFIENQFIVEIKQDNQDSNWQIFEPVFDNLNALSFESNDIVNRVQETPQYKDEKIAVESHLEEESMKKKSDIEMEIVSQGKAIIMDNQPSEHPEPAKLSFSEWLRQFKMTSLENITSTTPQKEAVADNLPKIPTQNIDNKTVTPALTSTPIHILTHIPTDNKHVLSESILALMFEKPQDLPENLFGLNNPSLDKNEDYFAENLDELSEDEMPKKKKKKKHMHELAAKSIEENDDMISETLADILAWQGNYKKSIEMYKRLCLLIPEKSDYFAAKIEKLRNTDL